MPSVLCRAALVGVRLATADGLPLYRPDRWPQRSVADEQANCSGTKKGLVPRLGRVELREDVLQIPCPVRFRPTDRTDIVKKIGQGVIFVVRLTRRLNNFPSTVVIFAPRYPATGP